MQPREITRYKQVKVENDRESMQTTADLLAEMQDPDVMWNYCTSLASVRKEHIPTKLLQPTNNRWLEWMDKKAHKLIQKHRRIWKKYRKTGYKFFLRKYHDERRTSKAECQCKIEGALGGKNYANPCKGAIPNLSINISSKQRDAVISL